MSTTTEDLTSDDIPPPPFSEDELREQWNAQADGYNRWECLGLDEQLAWAQTRAIEPLRPLLYQVARIAECIGHDAMSEIGEISDKAAAWLEENPSGAAGIDPRCCPPHVVETPVVEADPTPAADRATSDTNHPPLSPAARAVVDAWLSSERGQRMLGDPACLAAALRAAVAATQTKEVAVGGGHWICEAEELLDIAAELEGHRG